jgi:hypothetical protein
MNITEQQTEFLGWKVIPARLDATRTAWFLGFDPHEVPVLVGSGLLKPLGHPARNSTKFFATDTLEQFRRDEKWLARAVMPLRAIGGTATLDGKILAGVTQARQMGEAAAIYMKCVN